MQFQNEYCPILVTSSGIVMDFRFVQKEKTPVSILVMNLGRVMELRKLQPVKASDSMEVTLSGIAIEDNEMQS